MMFLGFFFTEQGHRHTLFVAQARKKQPEPYVDLRLQFIINIGLKHIKYLRKFSENSKIVEKPRTMEAKIVSIKKHV